MHEKCEKCGEHIDEYGCCCLSDETKDNMAVDKFAKAMKEKLAKARAKGRRGWDDKEACSDEHLAHLFHEHLSKCNDGNFIDLANFLMFLHLRGADPKVLGPTFLLSDCNKIDLDDFKNQMKSTVIVAISKHEAQLNSAFVRDVQGWQPIGGSIKNPTPPKKC